jgi:hypothetical protein
MRCMSSCQAGESIIGARTDVSLADHQEPLAEMLRAQTFLCKV